MVKRQLTEDERTIALKQVDRLKETKEYSEYLQKYSKLMIDEGLNQNFKKQLKEWNQKLKECESSLNETNILLSTLDDQLTNGVEVKEKSDVVEASDEEEIIKIN